MEPPVPVGCVTESGCSAISAVSSGTQVSAENARSSSRRDGLAVSQSTKPTRAPPAHTAFHGDASR